MKTENIVAVSLLGGGLIGALIALWIMFYALPSLQFGYSVDMTVFSVNSDRGENSYLFASTTKDGKPYIITFPKSCIVNEADQAQWQAYCGKVDNSVAQP
jgi:hypothetical protein